MNKSEQPEQTVGKKRELTPDLLAKVVEGIDKKKNEWFVWAMQMEENMNASESDKKEILPHIQGVLEELKKIEQQFS